MFVVFLRFSENKSLAPQFMDAHNDWIKRGFDDGVFLVVGSLQPKAGGAIIAQGCSFEELEARVADDPFVTENVVHPDIHEISPSRMHDKLSFLS